MYTLIGGDGKEYGPATPEQVRAWITSGRANLDTRAKAAGSDEWRRLGDFADFGGAGAAAPTPAPAPAAPPMGDDPGSIASGMIARAGRLDIGSCYQRSWDLLKAHFWPLVGTTALVVLCEGAISRIPVLGPLALCLLCGVFYGGLYFYLLQMIRGRPATVGDAFSGFTLAFVPLMLAGLMVSILTTLGLILLILPGIYLCVAYLFTYLLVIDRKLSFWTAMEVSRRVITSQWWRLLGLVLLALLFAILGCALLLVGVFAALPLIFGAAAYAYEDLCNPPAR